MDFKNKNEKSNLNNMKFFDLRNCENKETVYDSLINKNFKLISIEGKNYNSSIDNMATILICLCCECCTDVYIIDSYVI